MQTIWTTWEIKVYFLFGLKLLFIYYNRWFSTLISVDVTYDLRYHSDGMRVTRHSRVFSMASCPVSDKSVWLVVIDICIVFWDMILLSGEMGKSYVCSMSVFYCNLIKIHVQLPECIKIWQWTIQNHVCRCKNNLNFEFHHNIKPIGKHLFDIRLTSQIDYKPGPASDLKLNFPMVSNVPPPKTPSLTWLVNYLL